MEENDKNVDEKLDMKVVTTDASVWALVCL